MNKTYDPRDFEDKIYKAWLEKGYFSASPSKDKKPFTLLMPPPNITGQLHIGHALNSAIQDSIIRFKRMQGFEALYMPGTDHASIATEVKIVEALAAEGISKREIGREEFLKRAFLWNDKYGSRITEQQRKLGLSCDWQRSAFTMDEKRSESVREAFVSMYEQGLIYRGERIINWCPSCKTALSDAEVEFESSASSLWHIKYPVAGGGGKYLVVATTRPETMLGDTAVAVNPFDARYKPFVGKDLILPLTGRIIPVIADDYVEKDFGSGAVKITPAHDPNDFEVGLRHNLPVIKVIADDGLMNDEAGAFKGMTRLEARKAVVAALEKQEYLLKTEPYTHNVGKCYRCKDTIEPNVSEQWFVKMEQLAKLAIEAVQPGKTRFIPKRFTKNYLHWMAGSRDWCISRQLWWGHRIPVFYCDSCGMEKASRTDIGGKKCDCGGKFVQDEDVLDTWFSSALWPFSTLDWPKDNADLDYFYPTDTLVTAYDIIGSWVSRMIFSGMKHMGQTPFKDVVIHGIVRDDEGKKMSKSSGNGVDPLEAIETAGADALRISLVAGISMGGDMKYSPAKLETYRNFMNKIWNAARFVLSSCEGCKITDISALKGLSVCDKWILGRLGSVTKETNKLLNCYEVGLAASLIYEFVWNEFCDWYIEASKIDLNSSDEGRKNRTASVLMYVLREILKLAHPIIPFITAEIYNALPNKDFEDIMIAAYPVAKRGTGGKAVAEMQAVIELVKGIRNLRREMNVSQSKRTALYLIPLAGKEKTVQDAAEYIKRLAFSSDCRIITQKPTENCASLVTSLCEAYIPMGELVDIEKELIRLKTELEAVEKELERANAMLANQGFVAKAPPALIDKEKEKLRQLGDKRNILIGRLEVFKS